MTRHSTHVEFRRAVAAGPAALERHRERSKARKAKKRAANRAKGLASDGKPLKDSARQRAYMLTRGLLHPIGCLCYSCLFPEKPDQPDIEFRMRGRVVR